MATRQERLAARKARLEKQADTIVKEAVERVVAARPSPAPSSQEATPEAVKKMRDETNASWMAIGKHFGLPGAKYGAGRARALYAAANGGTRPRTYAPRASAPKKPQQAADKTIPAYVRKQALVDNGHVIPRDMPDEEVEAYLVGRNIEWAIDLARLTDTDPAEWGGEGRFFTQEARVHPDPKNVAVVDRSEEGKDRVVYFREYAGRMEGRVMSGPTRCVRVDAIFTVR